jgi:alkyldihydroxyacetonephosphate synthase
MAVVFPRSTGEVATAMAWAAETGSAIVPRGAGSGVCGGAQAAWRCVVLDLSRMNRLLSVDEESLALEVEAGARGDRVEAALNERGLTVGHYPQSLAISSIGGWLATRSGGQASPGYGMIEDLVLGLVAVLPGGDVVRLRATPRSAAGPDLRQLLLGSEGTLAVISEATLSVARMPEGLRWLTLRTAGFTEGMGLVREVIQRDVQPLVVRLYDDADAMLTFGAMGHQGGSVLILGFDGGPRSEANLEAALGAAQGASELPEQYGQHWWDHRNDAIALYRRIMGGERMLGPGVIVDTMEVAGLWSHLASLYEAVREPLAEHAANPVGCHVSHPYRSGASLFFTFLIHASDDDQAERRYLECWEDAARACHQAGGTVSHHHGIGLLKAPFLERELGVEGLSILRSIKSALDPSGILNPGKLLPSEGRA